MSSASELPSNRFFSAQYLCLQANVRLVVRGGRTRVVTTASRTYLADDCICTRDLHGNGDNGNTAVMEATAAVIPRLW